jgi:CubicO group peptidase (beta-lactamase class C family)
MEMGIGFGLWFAINCEPGRNPLPGSKGLFYWYGSGGTTLFVDPKEELIAIAMTQARGQEITLPYRMRHYAYQAIGE